MAVCRSRGINGHACVYVCLCVCVCRALNIGIVTITKYYVMFRPASPVSRVNVAFRVVSYVLPQPHPNPVTGYTKLPKCYPVAIIISWAPGNFEMLVASSK